MSKIDKKKCDNFKNRCKVFDTSIKTIAICMGVAMIAQLGERYTEDLNVPGSIPGRGIFVVAN